jgi:hypothetical protein
MLTWAEMTDRERELMQDFAENPVVNDKRFTDATRLMEAGLVNCDKVKSKVNYYYELTFAGKMMLAANKELTDLT